MNRNKSKSSLIMSKQFFKKLSGVAKKIPTLCHILFKEKDANAKKNLILKTAFKPLMLTKYGRKIRRAFSAFRPWCKEFPQMINILSDGSVTTCCFDPYGKNRLGSVYKHDISEIWNNKVKNILMFGDLYDLKQCRDCIGTRHAPILSKKNDYSKWQNFAYRHPKVIQIEIMGRCNYGCCCSNEIYKYRKNNETKPNLDKIFDNIKSFLPKIEKLNLFNHGEPLLHDGFCVFVKKCRKESDKLKMCLCTNGMLMDEKISRCLIEQKINYVSISVHGGAGTENMLKYSKYGADYSKVMANIKQLTKLRKMYKSKLPSVVIDTILFNWNDTDEMINRLRKDAKAVGVDKINWVLDGGTGRLSRSSKRFPLGSDELQRLQQRDIFN